MEEVLKQAPLDLDKDLVESIFNKNNQNVLDTLSELWNIKKEDNDYNFEKKDLKWSKNEDLQLIELYLNNDKDINELSKIFKKTPGQIAYRLQYHKIINYIDNITNKK